LKNSDVKRAKVAVVAVGYAPEFSCKEPPVRLTVRKNARRYETLILKSNTI